MEAGKKLVSEVRVPVPGRENEAKVQVWEDGEGKVWPRVVGGNGEDLIPRQGFADKRELKDSLELIADILAGGDLSEL